MAPNPVDTFLHEAEELLAEIETAALSMAAGEAPEETVHLLFRAFHTIKGSGAMCGLDAVAGFTHHIESLLAQVRDGVVPVSGVLAALILKAKDQIRLLLDAELGGDDVREGSSERLIEEARNLAAAGEPGIAAVAAARSDSAAGGGESGGAWLIEFRPNAGLFARGGNPLALLKDLRRLGSCEVVAHTDLVPELDGIQPDQCYLWWSIRLTANCDENAVRDVFIFVEDECLLEVKPAGGVVKGTVRAPEVQVPGAIAATRTNNSTSSKKSVAKESTVRVPSSRLDRLVNLVGELVMNQSRLAQSVSQHRLPELANPVQELERLVAELRDNVLGIRMLPIGTLFGGFRRLVHDLSNELGKEADLLTEGAETELDKSILDQLGEPLVHCLRNCLDHGAELPDEREARGKPRRVKVHLSATHIGSNVVVCVEDDGRGIDLDAVRAKAVEKQLIAADASLSERELQGLILLPGFSTASKVTSVSGRGVGMDAVKRQIDTLRGSLAITSERGKGTRISITLPLTLAIIEGLLIQIGNDQFIVPMAVVNENVELLRSQRCRSNGRNLIAVRGELVPYIDLRRMFRMDGAALPIEKVVIVQHEEQRVGMVVDFVLGTHQTVIQSLGGYYRDIEVVSGATIMGDGRVALILNIPAIVRMAQANPAAGTGTGSRGCLQAGARLPDMASEQTTDYAPAT
ncbi:chemotaxis protein CheA [Paludibaculum fermentans]|uniref:Chemotaxis protein CheA n=1 Tax=Paludibaculum fermentans TaxID=1473598 RepID=A0A7S7NKG8_PALFE|nr:chemotaxis protein CheA [Paludibaculum fermentans]QOY85200.1 chemotaxis protein CheA [Paludibaculum fermentans]